MDDLLLSLLGGLALGFVLWLWLKKREARTAAPPSTPESPPEAAPPEAVVDAPPAEPPLQETAEAPQAAGAVEAPTEGAVVAEPEAEAEDDVEAALRAAFEAGLQSAEAHRESVLDEPGEPVITTPEASEQRDAERLEAERLEAERLEAERLEAERLEAERLEAERLEAERLEAERLEAERLEAERREAERLEAERLEAERLEAERREADQREAERLEAEQREAERLEAEQREAERLAAQSPAQMAVAPPLPSLHSRELRADETVVFVVDDSKVVRVKTQRALAPQGYQVVVAESGEEAVAKMALHTPHVVITDVEMPGMDGFELTRYVRASATLGAIPVIMITSADDRKAAADAAGVTTLLGKPYAEADLIACIERARLAVQVPA